MRNDELLFLRQSENKKGVNIHAFLLKFLCFTLLVTAG